MRHSGFSRSAVLGTVFTLTGGVLLASGCGADDANRRVHRDHDAGPDAGTGGARVGTGGKASTGGKAGTGGASGEGGDASADGGAEAGGGGTGGVTPDASPDATDSSAGGAASLDCDGGGTACPGATACVDLTKDSSHCGDCARDCSAIGTTCTAGRCAPAIIDANANALMSTLGGGAMYIMQVNALPASHYTIVRIPLDGTKRTTVWDADGGVGDATLYADATDVYWSNAANPSQVLKKAGTAALNVQPTVVFNPEAAPRRLFIQGGSFYWVTTAGTTTAYIYSRPVTDTPDKPGTKLVTVNQTYVTALVVTTDAIYWIALNKLWTVPLAGGTPTEVPGAVVQNSAPLVAVGKKIYFARADGSVNPPNGIWEYSAGDATATQLVAATSVNALMVDSTSFYYRSGYADATILKAPVTGLVGMAGTPIVTRADFGAFVGQDETYIYTSYPWGNGAGPALKIAK